MRSIDERRSSDGFQWVGRRVPRLDGPEKVTGRTKYMTDLHFANAAYGRVLRAAHPHAIIRRIEVSRARALPGVICVLTAADIPGLNGFGIIIQDQPVLAREKVRMTGDAVALVAAESEELAEQALALIEVDYEPLPAVTEPLQALAPGAPPVHEGGNLLQRTTLCRGDVARAFAEADAVVEGTFETPRQMHAFIETEGGWARLEPDGSLTIWCPAQAAYRDRLQVARILGWNPNRIRIISSPLGGGFGGKDELTVQHYLALLALHTGGRPVKLHYKREESVVAGIKRHPFRVEAWLGANRDGTITALQARIVVDKGAYASLGPAVLNLAVEHIAGPYKVEHVAVEGLLVYTNNGTNGAFRGFGVPQTCFALESLVEMAAERLGIDPLALRKQNVVRRGEVDGAGHRIESSVAVWECLDAVERSSLWEGRAEWVAAAPAGKLRGYGVACGVHGVGLGKGVPDFANAAVELTAEGRFRLLVAPQEIGQGNGTIYAQMAAEVLGCAPDEIEVVQGDTGQVPDGGTVTASRGTYAGGMATVNAAKKMATLLGQGAPPPLRAEGYFILPQAAGALPGIIGAPHHVCGYAAQAVLLEVDALTGETRVERVVSAIDCGRVINPTGLEGQSEGGVVMGVGFALCEDTLMEGGLHRTRNLTTYILPTTCETPAIETIAVESCEETGPFGAKGIGEVVMVPVVAAIPNAIARATGRVFRLPATPERVWAAMRKEAQQP
ncbi:MAG: oxidoreductase [Symbiobacteriaceae bacterium]|jgi:CO/xanthine dehydrogenase Mo-binding subunit|nr:oxidoreductase [Symbiobacteriaceae bacterium]